MPFPTTPSNTLEQLQYDVSCWVDQSSDEFYDSINEIIQRAEKRIWRNLNVAVGYHKIDNGSLTSGVETQSIYPSEDYSVITSIRLSSEDYLLNKNETFISELNDEVDSGVPRYYCVSSDDGYEPVVLIAPIPDSNYQYVMEYRTLTSLIDNTDGTWLTSNASDILFHATVLESLIFLKYPKDQIAAEEQVFKLLMEQLNGLYIKEARKGYFERAIG